MYPSERIPRPHWLWAALAGILLIMVGVAVWYFMPDNVFFGGIAVIAGSGLLIRSTSSEDLYYKSPEEPPIPARGFRLSNLLIVPGIGLCLYAAWYASNVNTVLLSIWLVWGMWLCGIVLTCMAFLSWSPFQYWISETNYNLLAFRRETIFVIILTIVAFLIRVIGLGSTPPILFPSEARFALDAASLFHNWTGFSTESHFFQALGIQLFGQNIGAVRLPSAILGALTVPGLYLMARRMFSPRTAVVAALFLATFPLHIHFSRIGLTQAYDVFMAVWTFAFLSKALPTGSRMDYVLAGVCIGFSLYGSAAASLVPILAVIFVVTTILLRPETPLKRWAFVPLIVAIVVLLPQFYTLITQPAANTFTPIAIWQHTNTDYDLYSNDYRCFFFLLVQLYRSFLGYILIPDAGTMYASTSPMLGWLNIVPFVVGFWIAFLRLRTPEWLVILLWICFVSIFGGILLINPPQYQRYVIAVPAVAMLFALGLLYISDMLVEISRRVTPEYVFPRFIEKWMVPLMVITVLALFNVGSYLFEYPETVTYATPQLMVMEASQKILPRLDGYKLWYISASPDTDLATSPVVQYLNPDVTGETYTGTLDSLIELHKSYNGNHAILIDPLHPDSTTMLQALLKVDGLYLWPPPQDFRTAKFPSFIVFASTPFAP